MIRLPQSCASIVSRLAFVFLPNDSIHRLSLWTVIPSRDYETLDRADHETPADISLLVLPHNFMALVPQLVETRLWVRQLCDHSGEI